MTPQDAPVPIPHHPQETDHTCGPAALKMVLDALWGLRVEEERLAQHLGTEPGVGTRQRVMARFLGGLGVRAVVRHTDTRIDDIRAAMRTRHVVLVCYWLPDEGTDHYAVVARVLPDHIVLQDPWKGPGWTLDLATFERDWRSDATVATRRHRWFVAIEVPPAAGAPPALPVPVVLRGGTPAVKPGAAVPTPAARTAAASPRPAARPARAPAASCRGPAR